MTCHFYSLSSDCDSNHDIFTIIIISPPRQQTWWIHAINIISPPRQQTWWIHAILKESKAIIITKMSIWYDDNKTNYFCELSMQKHHYVAVVPLSFFVVLHLCAKTHSPCFFTHSVTNLAPNPVAPFLSSQTGPAISI